MSYNRQRITLRAGDLSITVPNILEDEQIRWQIERGVNLWEAYQRANVSGLFPDVAVRKCIEMVFKEPYYDPDDGKMKTSPGQYTCVGFHRCLRQYAGGQAAFAEEALADRRIQIAENVYSPSPNEEACIKRKFLEQIGIEEAYNQCGAGEILPKFKGFIPLVEGAYVKAIGDRKPFPPLYDLTKRSYQLFAIQPQETPATPAPVPYVPPPATPTAEDTKKTPWIIYVIIAGVLYFLMKD